MSEFTPDPGVHERGPQGDRGERGPQGERGDRGDRGPHGNIGEVGDKGPAGDSGLGASDDLSDESPIGQAILVTVNAAIKRAFRVRNWIMALLVVLFIAQAPVTAYTAYHAFAHPLANAQQNEIATQKAYTDEQVRHECNALELLTATPVPKPANPAANPSRETTYQFYEAILYWEHADGCKVVKVPVK